MPSAACVQVILDSLPGLEVNTRWMTRHGLQSAPYFRAALDKGVARHSRSGNHVGHNQYRFPVVPADARGTVGQYQLLLLHACDGQGFARQYEMS